MRSSMNILVAEDSLVNQLLASRLLEREGHAVTIAANGLEAVEALRNDHFDLVLMDVEMPKMDGLAATMTIRDEEPAHERVPIVAVTATGDPQACLNAGMDDWLPKPLSLTELNRTLENLEAGVAR